MDAFKRAWKSGFGLETDVRDYKENLVISHDMANQDSISFDDFLDQYLLFGKETYLALNVKSDGLVVDLKKKLQERQIENYFVFDMSVPDSLHYLRNDMTVFTRRSEYESVSVLEEKAQGIWWDSFTGTDDASMVRAALGAGKRAALVSPELHGRDHKSVWQQWVKDLSAEKPSAADFMVCTDFPDEFQMLLNECEKS